MPASALVSAVIETAANKILALDSDSEARMASLKGARLIAYVDPLPFAIVLVFSEQVDVLTLHEPFQDTVATLNHKDCCIKTSLDTLPELKHTNQLTRLIQQNKLQVEGELAVAQQVSGLFQQLDIDVEELLAGKTNDVVAHQAMQWLSAFKRKATGALSEFNKVASNALIEEKQIAAPKLAVLHFSDEVNALRDDVARLDARLLQLEQKSI
ncbi:SCP2 sterol-binding domain-containing protein [Alteromonas sp. CI.11.F.A3]|uniref:ubiquinone biosynthesis accessory factor UbiJ n=1 Tax=Alteromonas sp. CI.11.F.A3 TaxID=3079555 RepID=UPI002943B46D|nr:SCP2 sterol-binding domain-containing protein [Alteromonas sp. CI.11.F.A3]WOI38025.1 SCP2 sterol-binding domain-containing protein [Alteromonas sp. CI.11.F.A3]